MTAALRALPAADLRQLAAVIRAERLRPPYGSLDVQRIVGAHAADAVARTLQALDADGLAPRHLALVLDIIAEPAAQQPTPVTLVATAAGEGAGLVRDTGAVVRELFASAERSVLVLGYAVHQGQYVFRELARRMEERPELRVRLCLDVARGPGDTSHPSEIIGRFLHRFRTQHWEGSRLPELFHDPRALAGDPRERASLHAKCVVVDARRAFISSANFTEAAQVRNVEVGLLVDDEAVAGQLVTFVDRLVATGLLRPLGML